MSEPIVTESDRRRMMSRTLSEWNRNRMRIYVGNLPYSMGDNELREMFEEFGSVVSSSVVMDRETGRSRGFGFVEMNDDDAQSAINAMNGREIGGRPLTVNEA